MRAIKIIRGNKREIRKAVGWKRYRIAIRLSKEWRFEGTTAWFIPSHIIPGKEFDATDVVVTHSYVRTFFAVTVPNEESNWVELTYSPDSRELQLL